MISILTEQEKREIAHLIKHFSLNVIRNYKWLKRKDQMNFYKYINKSLLIMDVQAQQNTTKKAQRIRRKLLSG